MAYFRPSDPGKSEAYDVDPVWFVPGFAIMFWVISSEPTSVTGGHVSKRIVLDHLPWSWLPALAAWLAFAAAFSTCRAQEIEAWSDLGGGAFGPFALGVLWRFLAWSVLAVGAVFLSGVLRLTYDAASGFILAVVVINAIIGVLRRPPESLWD
jgi:hypothetical protein